MIGEADKKRFFNFRNKKGLDAIVTTVIVILISLVAIGILWTIVRNLVSSDSNGISIGPFTHDMVIKKVTLDNNSAMVDVKRNSDGNDIKAIKFIFENGTSSQTIEKTTNIMQLEQQTFTFLFGEINLQNITKISIAPVIITDSGNTETSNLVNSFILKGTQVFSGTGLSIGNFQKYGPVGAGSTSYKVSSSGGSVVKISNVIITPLDVHIGDNQTFKVIAYSPNNITSVTATTELDTNTSVLNLIKTGNDLNGEVFEVTWQVHDTHSTYYRTNFTATDSLGNKALVEMSWTDPCTGINQGQNSIIDTPCTASSLQGLDGGNLTLNTGGSITITGSDFTWAPGYSIIFSGGSISLSGGALQKAYLYYADSDGDNYPPGSAFLFESQSSSLSGNVRLKDAIVTSGDCNDNNASIYQDLSCPYDGDSDGVCSDSTTATVCSGAVCSNAACSQTDCNDDNVTIYTTGYGQDTDGDGYGDQTLGCNNGASPFTATLGFDSCPDDPDHHDAGTCQ